MSTDNAKCPTCGGRGVMNDNFPFALSYTCNDCKGTGRPHATLSTKEQARVRLQRVVRCEGWVILHHDGKMELDYFHSKLDYEKYGGPPISKEEWMRRYRPDCTLHRVEISIAPNAKLSDCGETERTQ